jgi:hypothetical protein
MKKTRFTETQIVNILKAAEAGVSLEELTLEHKALKDIGEVFLPRSAWIMVRN